MSLPRVSAVSEPRILGTILLSQAGEAERPGRRQPRACSAGTGKRLVSRLCPSLCQRGSVTSTHLLSVEKLGFPLGSCPCPPEACVSLSSGKGHVWKFAETDRLRHPGQRRHRPGAAGGTCGLQEGLVAEHSWGPGPLAGGLAFGTRPHHPPPDCKILCGLIKPDVDGVCD